MLCSLQVLIQFNMQLYVVEGAVGSGKSYFVRHLRHHFKSDASIVFIDEPVEMFENWKGFKPLSILEDKPTQANMIQLHIIRTLATFYKNTFLTLDPSIKHVICDRYVSSSEIFTRTLFERGLISHLDKAVLLETLKDYIEPLPKPNGIIYLNRSPRYCIDNIKARGRNGEQSFCDTAYVSSLINNYDSYISSIKNEAKILITESKDQNKMIEEFKNFIYTPKD